MSGADTSCKQAKRQIEQARVRVRHVAHVKRSQ
jgi:hypothetical protein